MIDQTSPQTNDTLTATVTAHDADGNSLTYGYQWTRNGADIAGANTATLNMSLANRGDKGDLIRLRVTASDGMATSPAVTSSPVTVVNTPPTATVTLDSHSPGTDATLVATRVAVRRRRRHREPDVRLAGERHRISARSRPPALSDSFDLSAANHGDAGDTILVTVTPNDGTVNGAPASDTATVGSGATPPIFSDDFTSGDFLIWTANTRLNIDNATGSPAAPSARAQVTNQSAFAFRRLDTPTMNVCASVRVNVTSATGAIDLFRLRSQDNDAIIKVARTAAGTLQLRSDFGSTTQNSGIQLGTGFHEIELCGTVGTATTWDLYRDGVKIVSAWGADTGTIAVGRMQIGDTAARRRT